MSEHADGLLKVEYGFVGADRRPFLVIPGEDGLLVRNEANAERLALCWNFCGDAANQVLASSTLDKVCARAVETIIALRAARNALFGKTEEERYEVLQLIDRVLGGKL